jgi:hypothetical protein
MPFTSEAPTCAILAGTGFVYCTEGDTGSGFARYDIVTNTWTSLAPIPGRGPLRISFWSVQWEGVRSGRHHCL